MVDSFVAIHLAVLDDIEDGICKILRVGRCTCLVEYNLQLRFDRREVEHCLDEVLAIFGIKPCGAENQCLASPCLDGLLAM